jgi:hypothetical protein
MERTIIYHSPVRETTTTYYSPSRVITYSSPVRYVSPVRTYYSLAPVYVTTTTVTTTDAPEEKKEEVKTPSKDPSVLYAKPI